jgi:formylglycine-generating enzyme
MTQPSPPQRLELAVGLAIVVAVLAAAGVALRTSANPAEALAEPTRCAAPPCEQTIARPAMVRVDPTTFRMSADPDDPERMDDEAAHQVRITRPFQIATTEVTRELWSSVMGSDPSASTRCSGRCPVENMSWRQALAFCNTLSEAVGIRPAYRLDTEPPAWDRSAEGYRLPTEAEWELAAREQGSRYAGHGEPHRFAWFGDNADGPRPVGTRRANARGLHDMSGNVWEWVWDGWAPFDGTKATDPTGNDRSATRVGKGGAWNTWPDMLRIAARSKGSADSRADVVGLRLAANAPPR